MKKINDVISNVLRTPKVYNEYLKQRVIYYWEDIVGQRIAKYSYIDKIENGTLYVVVTNAPWMQQIKMQSNMIIKKVNEFYGNEIVQNMRLRTGLKKIARFTLEEDEKANLGEKFPFESVDINDKVKCTIKNKLANVKNDKLKEALEKLGEGTIKRDYFLKKEGIKLCPICKMYKDKDEEVCHLCQCKRHRNLISQIKAVIMQSPDMNYKECNEKFACKKDDYYEAKYELMQKYSNKNNCKSPSLQTMYIFTMLYSGKTKQELTDNAVMRYSEKYRRYYD